MSDNPSQWVDVKERLPEYDRDFNFISKCGCIEACKIETIDICDNWTMEHFFSGKGYGAGSVKWQYITLPKGD